jgi:hypothetical protein
MRNDFEGARVAAAVMSFAIALGSVGAAARAQDTSTRTTTTRTETAPDGTRTTTRTTTRGASTSNDPPAEPAPIPEDTSRHELLVLEAIGGYGYVNMRSISYANLYPSVVPLSGEGFAGGVAAGLRLSILTIGGRATLASYPGFEVGTAAGEITLRLPTPTVEPWIRAGVGYGWLGQANYDFPRRSDTSVYGYVFQGAIGVDIYLGKVVAIGGGFDVDILNMSRQPLPTTSGFVSPTGVDLTKDGNAVGLQIRGHVAVSLHF